MTGRHWSEAVVKMDLLKCTMSLEKKSALKLHADNY